MPSPDPFVVRDDRYLLQGERVVGMVFDQDSGGYAALCAEDLNRGIKLGEQALCVAASEPSIEAAMSKLLAAVRGLN